MDYSTLAGLCEYLEKTPARLKKISAIAKVLRKTDDSILPAVVLLLQGRVFPSWHEKEIGIAQQLMLKTISSSTGYSENEIQRHYKKLGDLGLVIEKLTQGKRQKTLFIKGLSVTKVLENLQKLAYTEGAGSQDRKSQLVSELLSSAQPTEAKYIVRTILGELRMGVEKGVGRDAIAKAFFSEIVCDEKKIMKLLGKEGKTVLDVDSVLDKLLEKRKIDGKSFEIFKKKNRVDKGRVTDKDLWRAKGGYDYVFVEDSEESRKIKKRILDAVEWAWFLRPDYGEVALIARQNGLEGLEKASLEIGKPVEVLLAEKALTLEEALKSFERPAIETKFDGARAQIHKKGKEIWIYTRRLENITKQFPDLVEFAKKCIKAKECIIEGELMAFDTKTSKPLPFQVLSQRIHRKYDIEQMAREIPVQMHLFDAIYVDGRHLFDLPLEKRRKMLENIISPIEGRFDLAEQLITKDLITAEKFYKKAIEAGQEGVMVKNLEASYQPGRRVAGGWLKVKPTLETLDVAIIGGLWGTGKRAGWIGSLILGIRKPNTAEFMACGMLGTGIKEKKTGEADMTFEELTRLLKPYICHDEAGEVKIRPKIVIEVAYEEIQKSPNYASGYALRFPRFIRLRADKGIEDADDLERLERIYGIQKGKTEEA